MKNIIKIFILSSFFILLFSTSVFAEVVKTQSNLHGYPVSSHIQINCADGRLYDVYVYSEKNIYCSKNYPSPNTSMLSVGSYSNSGAKFDVYIQDTNNNYPNWDYKQLADGSELGFYDYGSLMTIIYSSNADIYSAHFGSTGATVISKGVPTVPVAQNGVSVGHVVTSLDKTQRPPFPDSSYGSLAPNQKYYVSFNVKNSSGGLVYPNMYYFTECPCTLNFRDDGWWLETTNSTSCTKFTIGSDGKWVGDYLLVDGNSLFGANKAIATGTDKIMKTGESGGNSLVVLDSNYNVQSFDKSYAYPSLTPPNSDKPWTYDKDGNPTGDGSGSNNNPFESGFAKMPVRSNYPSGIIGSLEYGFAMLIWIICLPFNLVGTLFGSFFSAVSQFLGYLSGFNTFVGQLFIGLPAWLVAPIQVVFYLSCIMFIMQLMPKR